MNRDSCTKHTFEINSINVDFCGKLELSNHIQFLKPYLTDFVTVKTISNTMCSVFSPLEVLQNTSNHNEPYLNKHSLLLNVGKSRFSKNNFEKSMSKAFSCNINKFSNKATL